MEQQDELTRKGFMLVRLLTIFQILENSRYPKSLRELHSEVNQRMGWDWSERTLRRDIEILEELRVVRAIQRPGEFVFCWVGLPSLDSTIIRS